MNDSDEKFIKPCLIIPDIPVDFDPNAIPQSGEEYLMHMAYERNRLPAVSFIPHKNQETEEITKTTQSLESVSSDSQYALRSKLTSLFSETHNSQPKHPLEDLSIGRLQTHAE